MRLGTILPSLFRESRRITTRPSDLSSRWHRSDLRISHRHIPPGCPEVNGRVERSHKTDAEEFYRGRRFRNRKDLARKLKRWEKEYNEDQPV